MIIAGNSNVSSFRQGGLSAASESERVEVFWAGALEIAQFENGHPAGIRLRELFGSHEGWKFLSIGIHDIHAVCRAATAGQLEKTLDRLFEAYCRTFDELNRSGRFGWLVFPQPLREHAFPDLTESDILNVARTFNGRIERWCRERQIAVINPLGRILDPEGEPHARFLQRDGIHLNVQAAELYLEEIETVTGVRLAFQPGAEPFEPANEPESFCCLLLNSLNIPPRHPLTRPELEQALVDFVTSLLLAKGLELDIDADTELVDSGLMDSLGLVETYTFATGVLQRDLEFSVNLRELDTIGKLCEFLVGDGTDAPTTEGPAFTDFVTSLRGDLDVPEERQAVLEADRRIASLDADLSRTFIDNLTVVTDNLVCNYGIIYYWLALVAGRAGDGTTVQLLLEKACNPSLGFPFPASRSRYREVLPGGAEPRAVAQPDTARNGVFPESALAHRWLDGLSGIEIGASSHNPFGLNTRNVGLQLEGYHGEQLELAGEVARIHIVAPADEIPLPDDSEDFVLSSHVIEHCPDAVRALVEWYRIVRPGGYLFMIVPHRDAAPTDKGRPLTEWRHLVDDYRTGVDGESEPEANGIPFGYCHYHVFDSGLMRRFMELAFGDRLDLVDCQERDDKIGNGFTLVYRKTRSFRESFPWTLVDGDREIPIRRGGAPCHGSARPTLLAAANLVPFADLGQRERQDACIASITALIPQGIVPINVCYPDELLEPSGWQTAPVLRRSADIELRVEGRRKPFVPDLFDAAAAEAAERGIEWFIVTNSDIIHTEDLLKELQRLVADGTETVAVSRNEIERIEPDGTLIPGYLEIYGYDVFLCRTLWWRENRARFQPYIFGERAWDDAYAAIMACHSRFAMLYRDGLCFHVKHPTAWISGPYADYNMGLYTGVDRPYSERYEAFIKEVIRTDHRMLTQEKTESLLKRFFAPESHVQGDSASGPDRFVNICTVTYNRLEFTRQYLDALLRTTDYPHVITVIDNNSQDGTREYLTELHRKGVIKNLVLLDENVGVAKAANLGWSLEPDAAYYLKLDNDIVIGKSGWLTRMVETIEGIPALGAVAYNFEPNSYPLQEVNGVPVRIKPEGNLGGACILIPRRTHDLLGFWCEDYGLYGEEDYDYGIRIRLAGLANGYMPDEEIGFHLPAGRAAVIDMTTYRAADGMEEDIHAGYRAWKDKARKETIESGILLRNLRGYESGAVPLKAASPFARDWLRKRGDSTPYAAARGRSFTRVAVFSLDHPLHACARIRVLAPSEFLSDGMELQWAVKLDADGSTVDISLAQWADLIIIQRFFPTAVTAPIIELLLASGKPVIYETDDLLLELPSSNPHQQSAEAAKPFILDLISKASAVTVSTEEMRQAFAPYHRNIHVLPNLLDHRLWTAPFPTSPKGAPVVIGYAGTPDHRADLELLEEVLERISAKYGSRVAFRFIGCDTERIRKLPGFSSLTFQQGYENYAKTIQMAGIDIGLVPLADNRFNRCKSNIKWLEYSACGIAGIYADLPPYRSCVRNGQTGILVAGNAVAAWTEAIEELIENPDRRHAMALEGRTEVMASHTLKSRGRLYLDTWRKIAEDPITGKEEGMTLPKQPSTNAPWAGESGSPQISIIIPLFNKQEYTKQCLDALVVNTRPVPGYEILLVDNASSDGTPAYLQSLQGDMTVITNKTNQGFARACNQGARLAQGRYLLFLNNDTVPHPGWLEALIRGIEEDGADIVGARLLYPNGRIQHAGVAFDEQSIGYHIFNGLPADDPAVNRKRFMQCVTAACMLMKREVFQELGGFDEGFRNGFEDVDLCLRAGAAGKRILYTPESVLIHFEETSDGRKAHEQQNIQRYLARWGGRVRCDDGEMYRSEGYEKELLPDGRHRIRRLAEADAAVTPNLNASSKAMSDDRLEALLQQGNSLADAGKLDEALTSFEAVMRLCPDHTGALIGSGVVHLLQNELIKAAVAFSRVLRAEPENAKALCGLAMVRNAQGRSSEAVGLYCRALDADPENLTALHELVKLAYATGSFGAAVDRLEIYLMYHPGDPDMLFSLAGLLYKGGEAGKAKETLERLLALCPDYEGARDLVCLISGGRGNSEKAATTTAFSLESARSLKEQGAYAEALQAFSGLLGSGDRSVLADMGDCLANLGKSGEAVDAYQQALREYPADLKALVGLGVLGMLRDEREQAAGWFERALAVDGSHAKALCGLGMVRNLQNRHAEASGLFNRALDADPEQLPALNGLVGCAYQLGVFGEAERRLADYLLYHPADLDMLFSLAGMRYKMGNRAAALESIETVLMFEPGYQGGRELMEMIREQPAA